jgi:hypothetical protein
MKHGLVGHQHLSVEEAQSIRAIYPPELASSFLVPPDHAIAPLFT